MERIIAAIENATAALPTAAAASGDGQPVTARDWAAFFTALSEFAAKLIPLLIPLFVATTDDKN